MAIHNSAEVTRKLLETPEDIQDFLASSKCTDALVSIGEKYHLHVDQTGKLSDQVVYTVVGLETLYDFKERVIKELGIAEDTANLIIYDLNQNVFGPIRESMLAMVKQKVQAETPSQSPQSFFTPSATTPTNTPTQTPKASPAPTVKITAPSVGQFNKQSSTGAIFNIPKEEVDVKAKASDNVVVIEDKKPLDPYHEQV